VFRLISELSRLSSSSSISSKKRNTAYGTLVSRTLELSFQPWSLRCFAFSSLPIAFVGSFQYRSVAMNVATLPESISGAELLNDELQLVSPAARHREISDKDAKVTDHDKLVPSLAPGI